MKRETQINFNTEGTGARDVARSELQGAAVLSESDQQSEEGRQPGSPGPQATGRAVFVKRRRARSRSIAPATRRTRPHETVSHITPPFTLDASVNKNKVIKRERERKRDQKKRVRPEEEVAGNKDETAEEKKHVGKNALTRSILEEKASGRASG